MTLQWKRDGTNGGIWVLWVTHGAVVELKTGVRPGVPNQGLLWIG